MARDLKKIVFSQQQDVLERYWFSSSQEPKNATGNVPEELGRQTKLNIDQLPLKNMLNAA